MRIEICTVRIDVINLGKVGIAQQRARIEPAESLGGGFLVCIVEPGVGV